MKSNATLGIRLLAIYLFAASAIYFPVTCSNLFQSMNLAGQGVSSVLLYFVALVLSAMCVPFFLWIIAPWLASRIIAEEQVPTTSVSIPMSMFDFFRLGIILIGLFFVPNAFAQFISSIYGVFLNPSSIEVAQSFAYDKNLERTLISSAIQLVVGAVLIFFSTSIAQIFEKMRK